MMAVATMLCICKHNDNDDADDGNGDDNLLQGGEQSSSVRDRAGAGQGWILHNDCLDLKLKYMKRLQAGDQMSVLATPGAASSSRALRRY